jgi:hypothetical protein
MTRRNILILVLIVAVLGIGGLFLMTWEMDPPSTPVEKVIPNERFSE